MAIHRGIQSVIFYYISCAPCAEARYKRKRRKQAEHDREEKALYEELNPGLYRHPSPFATNPNWQVEIDLGPGKPQDASKKVRARNEDALRSRETVSSTVDSQAASSPDLGTIGGRNGSKLTVRQFQRDDEDLWDTGGASSTGGITRPATARTNRTGTSSRSYQSMQNPSINDWHPATVTRLDSREDVAWMLQPPPPAKVMSGQDRASRSRSDSATSKVSKVSSRKGEEALVRQISRGIVAENRKRADTLELPDISRQSSARTAESNRIVPPSINLDYSSSEDGDIDQGRRRRTRKSRPVNLSEDSTNSTSTVVVRRPRTAEENSQNKSLKVATRPSLHTIMSQTSSPTSVSPSARLGRKRNLTTSATDGVALEVSRELSQQTSPSYFSARSTKNDTRSLRVLQERTSNAHLNPRPRTAELQKSPSFLEAAHITLPKTPGVVDRSEDYHLENDDGGDDDDRFGTDARRQDSKGLEMTLLDYKKIYSQPDTNEQSKSSKKDRGRKLRRNDERREADRDSSYERPSWTEAGAQVEDANERYWSNTPYQHQLSPLPLPYRSGKDGFFGNSHGYSHSKGDSLASPDLGSAGLGSAAKDLHGILDMDLESWYEWASQTVQRRVSKRWSMDI